MHFLKVATSILIGSADKPNNFKKGACSEILLSNLMFIITKKNLAIFKMK